MSSQKTFRVARYVAVCAVTVLTFGATAHAEHASAVPKATVDYSDLDLAKQADAHALYGRLQRASERVCVDYKETRNLQKMKLYNACYQEALSRAVDNVGHASVQAIYASDERVRIASRAAKSSAKT